MGAAVSLICSSTSLIKGFIDYTQENNTRYSDYINQQAQKLNNNQERLNQTGGQLIRDINDIVKVVFNKIIHRIDDNENSKMK